MHLPNANGLSTVFGTVSARPHDVSGVFRMSGLDGFLRYIQQGAADIHGLFGEWIDVHLVLLQIIWVAQHADSLTTKSKPEDEADQRNY